MLSTKKILFPTIEFRLQRAHSHSKFRVVPMLEFLKIVANRLRLWMLLFALGLSILLYKVIGFDGGWMVFTFCVFYLVLLAVDYLFKIINKRIERNKESESLQAQRETDEELLKELIWQHFNVLDEYNLSFVKKVYNSKKDPYNPCVRYVQNDTLISSYITNRDEFMVPLSDRRCCWLLHPVVIGGTTVITFHPYYLRLVSHYVETGIIERV